MQLSIFDYIEQQTFSPPCRQRLNAQLQAVKMLMQDREWRTLQEIAANIHAPEASCSARLRDLRKYPFNHTVNRRHVKSGLHEYQLILAQ